MQTTSISIHSIKGRGAASAIAHRYTKDEREGFDDGWEGLDQAAQEQGEKLPIATQVHFEDVKSVITRNDSPDIFFDASINPYRGCEHGCVYCFARPTHSYLNLSPGLDFETQIIAKRNIADVLRGELAKKWYAPKLLNIGSATDCYQPVERELRLTRSVIDVLGQARHPYSLLSKSSGVERDIDLIAAHAHSKRAAVYISITTLDPHLARIMEPRAAAPHRRLRTVFDEVLTDQMRRIAPHGGNADVGTGFSKVDGQQLRVAVGHVQQVHVTRFGYVVVDGGFTGAGFAA